MLCLSILAGHNIIHACWWTLLEYTLVDSRACGLTPLTWRNSRVSVSSGCIPKRRFGAYADHPAMIPRHRYPEPAFFITWCLVAIVFLRPHTSEPTCNCLLFFRCTVCHIALLYYTLHLVFSFVLHIQSYKVLTHIYQPSHVIRTLWNKWSANVVLCTLTHRGLHLSYQYASRADFADSLIRKFPQLVQHSSCWRKSSPICTWVVFWSHNSGIKKVL